MDINNSNWKNAKGIMAYLARRGVPKAQLNKIMRALVEDAIQDAHEIKLNRVYTALALMLHRHLGFGPKRILAAIHAFDDVMDLITVDDQQWEDVIKQTCEETGLIFRINDNNAIVEYMAPEEREETKKMQ